MALLLLATMLLIGYFLAGDFGVSWDEPDNSAFGLQAIEAYRTLRPPAEWQSNLESKGPFFVALAESMAAPLARLRDSWTVVDGRHLAYYLSFCLSAVCLFLLARRFAGPPASLAATLLFVSQPLLFGHAFINPKDAPFMGFFLLAIWSGVKMVESMGAATTRLARLGGAAWAGVVLGLTTSIRLFGPFAGLLIAGLAFVRHGRRAVIPLLVYGLAAGLACFATWPYLWGDPVGRLVESLNTLMNFPWENLVLYRGLVYAAPALPWHYLPFTALIQLTEPVALLSVSGAGAALLVFVRRREQRDWWGLCALWIAFPFGSAILLNTTVYDNSRQFLFALPPLFLMAGLGFEMLFSRLRTLPVQILIAAIAITPGVLAIAQLHPYEYIYYNQLVGGVSGAYRLYELDYWATSYREAMQAIDRVAPNGATVEVLGPWMSALPFARPDLHVVKAGSPLPAGVPAPTFFLTLTRNNRDLDFMPEAPTVAEVQIAGATLAVVKSGPVPK